MSSVPKDTDAFYSVRDPAEVIRLLSALSNLSTIDSEQSDLVTIIESTEYENILCVFR